MASVHPPMLSRRESPLQEFAGVTPVGRASQELPEQPQRSSDPVFRQTIVVRNRQGREEAFTIGPDGNVWCFFPDTVDVEGYADYSFESLEMAADHLTVGRDAFGCLVVLAVKGLRVRYRVENETAESAKMGSQKPRWSAIGDAPLPELTGAVSVKRVYTQNDCGLRVAALIDVQGARGQGGVAMAYCQWKVNGPNTFRPGPQVIPH